MYVVFYAGRSEFPGLQVQLNDPLVFLEVAVVHTAVVGTCNAFIDVCNEINWSYPMLVKKRGFNIQCNNCSKDNLISPKNKEIIKKNVSHNKGYLVMCLGRKTKKGLSKFLWTRRLGGHVYFTRWNGRAIILSHTCTVVSIPAESRITKVVEQSLCICISGIVPSADVGIMNKLIYVWDQINTMICATMILGRE